MQTNKVISNSKIIIFLVFICCALITSLFVYHTSHKQQLTMLANGNATLFPNPRDIKPFKLASTNGPQFTNQNLQGHWTIAFFGFTHCAKVCPATMNLIANSYDDIHSHHPNLQVIFISLDPERDAIDKLTDYVHSYNKEFIGVAGKIQEIRKLQSEFGIFSARDEASGENYQLMHTPSILLINPQGKWVGLFKSTMNKQEFITAINQSADTHA